ncbi:MAG TPA: MFS transporter [Gemmatimonadaceae bacterium]|jgi:MFS family permease|nr:MFS transporter [Gemmatimonadaceae bacterium]
MAITAQSMNPLRVLLTHRDFRIFWSGQTTSLIGTWMQSTAQAWLALQLSNSAFVVGLVVTAGAFPILLLSLYGGVIADRTDKLRLVTIGQALLLVQAVALWWFVWSGEITVGWLLAFALVSGTINAFEIPARQSFIVELVGKEDLTDAIALNSGGFNLARVIGPSLAGIVIHRLGIPWAFALNALSYLAVLASLFSIRRPARAAARVVATPMEGLVEGLRFMLKTREVSRLIGLVAVYAIFGMPYLALMPVVARDVLRSDASGYGMLLTSVGIGGFAGALGLAAFGRRARRGRLLELSAYTFSLLLILFSFSRSLLLSAALLLFVGCTMILSNALANGLLQTSVPDELRGRVMSAYAWVFVGLGPVVGPLLAGALADQIGATHTIGVMAAVTLAYVWWVFRRRSPLRQA